MAGTAVGKAGDGSTLGEGGLAIFVNGAPQGVRPNFKYENTPGVRHLVVDQPAPAPARLVVTTELDAEVLLAPPATGLDLTTGTVLATLLTGIAAQLVHVTRLVLIAELITDVTVPDNIAGTLGGAAGSQALALTATGQIQELVLRSPRPGVDPGPSVFDEVILDQTAAPGGGFTAYTVTAQLWGVVLTP